MDNPTFTMHTPDYHLLARQQPGSKGYLFFASNDHTDHLEHQLTTRTGTPGEPHELTPYEQFTLLHILADIHPTAIIVPYETTEKPRVTPFLYKFAAALVGQPEDERFTEYIFPVCPPFSRPRKIGVDINPGTGSPNLVFEPQQLIVTEHETTDTTLAQALNDIIFLLPTHSSLQLEIPHRCLQ